MNVIKYERKLRGLGYVFNFVEFQICIQQLVSLTILQLLISKGQKLTNGAPG